MDNQSWKFLSNFCARYFADIQFPSFVFCNIELRENETKIDEKKLEKRRLFPSSEGFSERRLFPEEIELDGERGLGNALVLSFAFLVGNCWITLRCYVRSKSFSTVSELLKAMSNLRLFAVTSLCNHPFIETLLSIKSLLFWKFENVIKTG